MTSFAERRRWLYAGVAGSIVVIATAGGVAVLDGEDGDHTQLQSKRGNARTSPDARSQPPVPSRTATEEDTSDAGSRSTRADPPRRSARTSEQSRRAELRRSARRRAERVLSQPSPVQLSPALSPQQRRRYREQLILSFEEQLREAPR